MLAFPCNQFGHQENATEQVNNCGLGCNLDGGRDDRFGHGLCGDFELYITMWLGKYDQ